MKQPAFIPSVDKVRNAHFDESMESADSFLRSQHAVSVMGAEVIKQYVDVFQRTRLPNFVNQVIDITHFDQDDIPFVPVLKDETLYISDQYLKPTSNQRRIIEAKFGKNVIKRNWDKYRPDIDIIRHQEFDEGAFDICAPTVGVYIKPGLFGREEWALHGRPMIKESNERRISHYTPVLIHEWTHVLQHETHPIHKRTDTETICIADELGAYARDQQATAALELMGRGDEAQMIEHANGYYQYSLKIMDLCNKHSHDPFSPTIPAELVEDIFEYDPLILGVPRQPNS